MQGLGIAVNKEFSHRLEVLNASLWEVARARYEWDASPEPVDLSSPVGQAFERALVEYEAADGEMVEFMSQLIGRPIRQTARESMNPEGSSLQPERLDPDRLEPMLAEQADSN